MRAILTLGVLFGLLAATCGVAWFAWHELGDVPISRHGLIALGLGAGATLTVGVGLMALLFRSQRRGHDEAVYHYLRDRERHRRGRDSMN